MKKNAISLIFCMIISFAVAPLAAQNSKSILSNITSKIESDNMVEIKFEFLMLDDKGEEMFFDSGIFEAQDSLYRMKTSTYAIYCNAFKKWLYDIPSEEITIFSYKRSLTDITENPLLIFTSIEGNFTYSSKPKEYDNGKGWIIALKPVNKDFPYESIEIAVDKSTSLPVALRCIRKDKGAYVVTILSFELKERQSVDYFMLNTYNYPAAYVTDLSL